MGFWSDIQNAATSAVGIYNTVRPVWTGPVAQSNPGQVQDQPTFVGNPTLPTTAGTAPQENQSPNYTPFLIAGGVILAVILIAKA